MLNHLTRIVGTFAASMMLLAACGGGGGVDIGACPPNSEAQQQRGQDMITFSCTNFCHAEARTGEARAGAPEGMDFDTPEQMLSYAEDIYESIVRAENRMPPNGGLTGNQIEDVRVFLACGQ